MTPLLARLQQVDERLLQRMIAARTPPGDRVMMTITHLGGASVTLGVAFFLIALDSTRSLGLSVLATLGASFAAGQILKHRIARTRPQLPVGLMSLVRVPDRFSFPSGHATAALAVALPLAEVGPPAWSAFILAVAFLVGASRAYLGVHYPADVVMGWVLAIVTYLSMPLV